MNIYYRCNVSSFYGECAFEVICLAAPVLPNRQDSFPYFVTAWVCFCYLSWLNCEYLVLRLARFFFLDMIWKSTQFLGTWHTLLMGLMCINHGTHYKCDCGGELTVHLVFFWSLPFFYASMAGLFFSYRDILIMTIVIY